MTSEGRTGRRLPGDSAPETRLVLRHVVGPSDTLVVASGDLASETCEQLRDPELIGRDVVLDLREVTFVDSAGLNMLLLLDAATRGAGRSLSIDPGTALRRLLELCGMTDMLTLVDIADR